MVEEYDEFGTGGTRPETRSTPPSCFDNAGNEKGEENKPSATAKPSQGAQGKQIEYNKHNVDHSDGNTVDNFTPTVQPMREVKPGDIACNNPEGWNSAPFRKVEPIIDPEGDKKGHYEPKNRLSDEPGGRGPNYNPDSNAVILFALIRKNQAKTAPAAKERKATQPNLNRLK